MNSCDRQHASRVDGPFLDQRTGEHLCHECVIARAGLELDGILAVDDRINGVLERERRASVAAPGEPPPEDERSVGTYTAAFADLMRRASSSPTKEPRKDQP